jgi:hypothetical protein
MRIGVISDTHIPERASRLPEKVLQEFKKVDLILHAGDLVELKVLDDLRLSCGQVKAVYGNMDPLEVRDVLAEKEIIKINGRRIGLAHGFGPSGKIIESVSSLFKNDRVEAIVFGHSHAPINETREGIFYFNPGSPTDRIFAAYNSFGILELEKDKIVGRIIRI